MKKFSMVIGALCGFTSFCVYAGNVQTLCEGGELSLTASANANETCVLEQQTFTINGEDVRQDTINLAAAESTVRSFPLAPDDQANLSVLLRCNLDDGRESTSSSSASTSSGCVAPSVNINNNNNGSARNININNNGSTSNTNNNNGSASNTNINNNGSIDTTASDQEVSVSVNGETVDLNDVPESCRSATFDLQRCLRDLSELSSVE